VLAIAALAAVMAPVTAIFAIVDAWLWKPLPLPEPERLLIAFGAEPHRPNDPSIFTIRRFVDAIRPDSPSIEASGAVMWSAYDVATPTGTETFRALDVTPGFIPALWPGLARADYPAVYVSAAFAGRYPGRIVTLNGKPRPVAAVLPAGFDFRMLDLPKSVDIYAVMEPGRPDVAPMATVVRVRGSVAQATAELTALWETMKVNDYRLLVTSLQGDGTRAVRGTLTVLGAAIAALLLLACANVSSLLIGQGFARQREFAIRNALGATRWHLLRQTLRETAVLAGFATIAGTPGAYLLIAAFRSFSPLDTLPPNPIQLDGRALAVTAVAGLLATLASGILPALRASRLRVPRRPRAQFLLLTVQIALTAAILQSGASLVGTLVQLHSGPIGFDPARLYSFRTDAPLGRIQATPGIDAAAASSMPLLSGGPLAEVSTPDRTFRFSHKFVAGGFFATLRIPLLTGGEGDGAVLNQAAAEKLFGGIEAAIGQRVRVNGGAWQLVTGVASNTGAAFYNTVAWRVEPVVYIRRSTPDAKDYFFVRSPGPLSEVEIARHFPVREFTSARGAIRNATRQPEFRAAAILLFAGGGLLLAGLGVFSLTAQMFRHRKREIAVRVALGARAGSILQLLGRDVVLAIGAGLAGGAALGWVSSQPMAAILYGVRPAGAGPLAVTCLLASLMALAAAFPALSRAIRVSPAETLKHSE